MLVQSYAFGSEHAVFFSISEGNIRSALVGDIHSTVGQESQDDQIALEGTMVRGAIRLPSILPAEVSAALVSAARDLCRLLDIKDAVIEVRLRHTSGCSLRCVRLRLVPAAHPVRQMVHSVYGIDILESTLACVAAIKLPYSVYNLNYVPLPVESVPTTFCSCHSVALFVSDMEIARKYLSNSSNNQAVRLIESQHARVHKQRAAAFLIAYGRTAQVAYDTLRKTLIAMELDDVLSRITVSEWTDIESPDSETF